MVYSVVFDKSDCFAIQAEAAQRLLDVESLQCSVFVGGPNGGAKMSFQWAQHADLPMPLAQIIRDTVGLPSGMVVECVISRPSQVWPFCYVEVDPNSVGFPWPGQRSLAWMLSCTVPFFPKSASQWGVFNGLQQHLSIKFGIIATKPGKVIRAWFYQFARSCLWI